MFFVYFFDCLSSAHVPTFNPLFYCIYLAISNQVFVAAWVKIICDNIRTLLGSPHSKWPHTTKNISEALSRLNIIQNPIPLLLQSGTPIDLLEIEFEINSNFLHLNQVIILPGHMLEYGCTIYVMKFLRLIADGFDVPAFGQCYFSDYFFVFLLVRGEIVVGYMAGCLETIGERDWLFSMLGQLEHFEYLLIAQIIIPEHNITFDHLQPLLLLFPKLKHPNIKIITHQDNLLIAFRTNFVHVYRLVHFLQGLDFLVVGVGLLCGHFQTFYLFGNVDLFYFCLRLFVCYCWREMAVHLYGLVDCGCIYYNYKRNMQQIIVNLMPIQVFYTQKKVIPLDQILAANILSKMVNMSNKNASMQQ